MAASTGSYEPHREGRGGRCQRDGDGMSWWVGSAVIPAPAAIVMAGAGGAPVRPAPGIRRRRQTDAARFFRLVGRL
jgi:hypothetical protein